MFNFSRISSSTYTMKVIEFYHLPSQMTKGKVKEVTQREYDLWDKQLRVVNDSFELYLRANDKFSVLQGKMFWV